MPVTPVYIICSPRPLVGKTLIARLLSEFLLLKNGTVNSFDINLKEPSLLDYLPRTTETADVIDTYGKMQLMDRLIVDDGIAKVIDLGFHAFDEFFKMTGEIGFLKEAARRHVAPVILFVADVDRVSARAYPMLQQQIPPNPHHRRQRACGARRTARRDGARTGVADLGAADVPEDLYRPLELLVHRLPAHRKGFVDRTAPMDPPQLQQFPGSRTQPAAAGVVAGLKILPG